MNTAIQIPESLNYKHILELTTEKIPNGAVVVFDRSLRYLFARGESLKKHGLENVVGKRLYDILPEDAWKQLEPYYWAALQGESQHLNYDNGEGYFWTRFEPVWEKDKVIAGMVLVVEITNLILEKGQLSNKMHMISHDTKSPYNSIIGLLNLHQLVPCEEEKEHILQRIEQICKDGLQYIEGVLEENMAQVNFEELLVNLKNILAVHPNRFRVHFSYQLHLKSQLQFNLSLLRSLIENLVLNSYKYYDPQKEDSFVKLHLREDDTHLYLKVEDNGLGIEEEKQADIFKLGQRTHVEAASGYGVGLSIVQNIIEELQGNISLHSQLSQGTQITIQIPNS